ncbi:MAG: protein phosphatase 2C domain-containing protein [Pseudomonadota bacterium]
MSMIIDACTAQHQGCRKEQQDQVAIVQHPKNSRVILAALADGMGGHTGGLLAAQQVIHTAVSNIGYFSEQEDVPISLLENCIKEAHMLIRASRFINEQEPHSTAVLLLLQPAQVSWAYCGDSRFYHFRGNQLLLRSIDHSYVESLLQNGLITVEQAMIHPERNILTTSLGGAPAPKISSGSCEHLQENDSFLLCSDGLWAYFSDAELAAFIAASSAREAASQLIAEALRRGRGMGDNISVAIFKLLKV